MKIDIDMILLSHQLIIESTGGSFGVRDIKALESVLGALELSYGGVELYPSKEDKAAFLALGIIKNHAFIDGNKRVGINAMLSYLHLNGIKLDASDGELEELGFSIAASKLDTDSEKVRIKGWILGHESK